MRALRRSDGAKGGRPPYDAVLMFKILVLQTLYTLSNDQAEFQIRVTRRVDPESLIYGSISTGPFAAMTALDPRDSAPPDGEAVSREGRSVLSLTRLAAHRPFGCKVG